jgi:aminopeptidase N
MKTENAPATEPQTIYLKDYQKPDYLLHHTSLSFDLSPTATRVQAALKVVRNEGVGAEAPLVLNGEFLKLESIVLDGKALGEDEFETTDKHLTVKNVPAEFALETVVTINPEANTALSGLYMSNGMFCTQCEAEGFRRITYYPDRPDVLATFDVRIEADKSAYPVLLANGNPGEAGELEGGRHFATWSDPHPKPAYLFALVGGDLAHVEDSFTTQSGRDVTLQVFVQPQNIDKCDYTLDALKRSMKWDEEVFGREYDLDIFMIVAVDHFNFGAMENKGLNIFNSAYVLASPETATDTDYELIESIVAHEYFHNWSGNRVTCRDWFQLCLKEGFTVFRDQEFSADMRSRPVQRIKDVRRLWARQFPEDAGPLAHPARPESYITIDNFYTATVYEKGAELVRMMKTMIGPQAFRKATDLYFDRHDGEAATVEDFITCMEEASGLDLGQFRRWYSDAGTPEISVKEDWADGTYTLTLTQDTAPTPGQEEKPARHIPMRVGLVTDKGEIGGEELVHLKEGTQSMTMRGLPAKPVASVFRGFSAPVTVKQDLSIQDRLALIAHDSDAFNRWATANKYATDVLKSFAGDSAMPEDESAATNYARAVSVLLADKTLEPAFKAEVLRVPSETDIARTVSVIDPEAISAARKKFRQIMLTELEDQLFDIYEKHQTPAPYSPAADQAGKRTLKNTSLGLLMADPSDKRLALALSQAKTADNMTDEAAAVSLVALADCAERQDVLAAFYDKWQHEPLVVNKWLAWQAMASGTTALDDIKALSTHAAFDMKNPNKVRSLIGAFAMENLSTFHLSDGSGYDFFFEKVRELDSINPQVAARLLGATESWRRLEPSRQEKLGTALKALADTEGLSENVFEMATRLVG